MGANPDQLKRAQGQQVREILDDLVGMEACELYIAACEVIAGGDSTARRLMAAAGLREIMDLIEEAAGYKHQPPDGRQAVSDLDAAWKVAQRTETGSGSGLAAFEPTLQEFLERFRRIPPRRSLSLRTLEYFDPTLRGTSPAVQSARVRRWTTLRQDLNDVVHRNTTPSSLEFDEILESFEQFLVRWLRPPTAADQSAIDELLQGGPPNA